MIHEFITAILPAVSGNPRRDLYFARRNCFVHIFGARIQYWTKDHRCLFAVV